MVKYLEDLPISVGDKEKIKILLEMENRSYFLSQKIPNIHVFNKIKKFQFKIHVDLVLEILEMLI